MPLKNYGVLKGRPINRQLGSGQNPHDQVHVVDEAGDYRLAVNVLSQMAPSEVEYLVESRFQHPFLAHLDELPPGWHKGGLITLLNAQGLRVDGVSYTQAQASNPGFSVKF